MHHKNVLCLLCPLFTMKQICQICHISAFFPAWSARFHWPRKYTGMIWHPNLPSRTLHILAVSFRISRRLSNGLSVGLSIIWYYRFCLSIYLFYKPLKHTYSQLTSYSLLNLWINLHTSVNLTFMHMCATKHAAWSPSGLRLAKINKIRTEVRTRR